MKIIEAKYDEISGYSQVVIEYKGKLYVGSATCHPEEEFRSKFAGCRYAELRAKIKALKAERRKMRQECELLRKFVAACGLCKNFDKDTKTAKVVYRQLNTKIREVNKLTDKINNLLEDLEIGIKQRDIVNKALQNKRSKKDN